MTKLPLPTASLARLPIGKPVHGMGTYRLRRSTRRVMPGADKGTCPALFQVEPLNSAKGVCTMANGEKKADVARALIAHTLNVTACSLGKRTGKGVQTRMRTIGSFNAAHHVIAGAFEIVDVWQGPKVFSARRPLNDECWDLVSFKRGDWESAFLCAA